MKTATTKVPQYKNLKFESKTAFEKWLDATATKKITFEDNGQDLLEIHVDDAGEILDANLQTGIWCGKFINLDRIQKGVSVRMWNEKQQDWELMLRLRVESCEIYKRFSA